MKLVKYTIYVDEQQKSLDKQEKEKLRLQKVFFKEDKEIKHLIGIGQKQPLMNIYSLY